MAGKCADLSVNAALTFSALLLETGQEQPGTAAAKWAVLRDFITCSSSLSVASGFL